MKQPTHEERIANAQRFIASVKRQAIKERLLRSTPGSLDGPADPAQFEAMERIADQAAQDCQQ